MLGALLAFVLFGGLVADSATGHDYLSAGPEKLCAVMHGEYKGTSEVGGNSKDAVHATVPYCTAGPSTLVEGFLRDKGVID